MEAKGKGWNPVATPLPLPSTPHPRDEHTQLFITDRSKAVLSLW